MVSVLAPATGRNPRKALLPVILAALGGIFPGLSAPPVVTWRSYEHPTVFVHLTKAQGLSQGTVNCILQDKQGFLWFGTERGGLDRYDGTRFSVIHHAPTLPQSLSSENISCLLEDRAGNLWIGQDGGLDRIDKATGAIHVVRPARDGDSAFPDDVAALAEDRQGNVWLGSGSHGLFLLPGGGLAGDGGRRIPAELTRGAIGCLFVDSRGTLWVGMADRGLYRLAADGGFQFTFQAPDPAHPDASAPADAIAMAEDSLGVLWIGTKDGLYSLIPGTGRCRRYRADPRDPQALQGNLVRRVYRDRAGTLWLGTDGGGLHKLLPRARAEDPPRFRVIRHQAIEPGSLASDAVESIYEDRSGVLWVGTFSSGLNKLVLNSGRDAERERESLLRFALNPADPASLGGNLVNCMTEDRFGNLWVGTDLTGLSRAAPPASRHDRIRFEHFRAGAGGLQDDAITCALRTAEGQLWLGSFTGGLIRVDQAGPRSAPSFRHFRPDPGNPGSSANFVAAAKEDQRGRIWVATAVGGLWRFDPATGAFARIKPRDPPEAWNPDMDYTDLAEDSHGTLWLTSGDGIDRYNPDTGGIRCYRHSERADSPGFRRANALSVARDGRLYVAANGGLDVTAIPPWDGPAPAFTHFGTRDGLPGDLVVGVREDALGGLWVSTLQALCRFDPATGKARPFIWQQDLQGTEFFPKAHYLARSGELFFGGSNGLFLFAPGEIAQNSQPAPIVITDFQLFGQSVAIPIVHGVPEITLSPSEYLFSLEFAALHYVAPEANRYAYMMEGLDRGWNESGNRHFVTYTTLPPGDYMFRVRAANCDGVSVGRDLDVKVHVLPPFWRTLWFWLPMLGLLGGILALLVRRRMAVLTVQTRRLEEQVEARTRELAMANQALLDQSLTDPLTGLHNRRYLDATIPGILAQALRAHRAAKGTAVERLKQNVYSMFAMVDLDHFKQVNDTFGHPAGDQVLRQIGEILRGVARTSDTVVRMGGEEFLVIARSAGLEDVETLPERIRAAVAAHAFDIGREAPIQCTCSVGFCLFPVQAGGRDLLTWEEVLALADLALYAGKNHGRNAWVGVVPNPEGLAGAAPDILPGKGRDLLAAGLVKVVSSLGWPVELD